MPSKQNTKHDSFTRDRQSKYLLLLQDEQARNTIRIVIHIYVLRHRTYSLLLRFHYFFPQRSSPYMPHTLGSFSRFLFIDPPIIDPPIIHYMYPTNLRLISVIWAFYVFFLISFYRENGVKSLITVHHSTFANLNMTCSGLRG